MRRSWSSVPTGHGSISCSTPRRVDVAIMHAPEPFQAMKRGWAVVEDLGRLDIAFQNSCAATTRRMMRERRDIADRYVRAFCQGVYRFRTDAAFGVEVLAQVHR